MAIDKAEDLWLLLFFLFLFLWFIKLLLYFKSGNEGELLVRLQRIIVGALVPEETFGVGRSWETT
jgi:hypothetical protein